MELSQAELLDLRFCVTHRIKSLEQQGPTVGSDIRFEILRLDNLLVKLLISISKLENLEKEMVLASRHVRWFDVGCREVLARYERRFGKGHRQVDLEFIKGDIYNKGLAQVARKRFGKEPQHAINP